MRLIVITSPTPILNEHEIINTLFETGLELLQIHKPDFSKEELKKYIQQISFKYHNQITLHTDFPKFHSLKEMEDYEEKYEYAFLSPIFDSISKIGYKSSYNLKKLKEANKGKNIIALGGINEDKIEICKGLGFSGVAVLGAIWNYKNPIEIFLRIKEKCQKKDLTF